MGSGFGGGSGSGLLGGLGVVFMGIIPLLLIGLVVWAIVEATRRRNDHHPATAYYPMASATLATQPLPTPSTARALLDERYARGDIGRDEYLQRRADLG
jgi:putative membrane protein